MENGPPLRAEHDEGMPVLEPHPTGQHTSKRVRIVSVEIDLPASI
jgi:hypothetical protein